MFSGKYAVEIPVGERKIFLKTKPCAPLQIFTLSLEKAGLLLTLPQTIMNIQMNLISATAFYKAIKLSI
jgi:hypothetical protein